MKIASDRSRLLTGALKTQVFVSIVFCNTQNLVPIEMPMVGVLYIGVFGFVVTYQAAWLLLGVRWLFYYSARFGEGVATVRSSAWWLGECAPSVRRRIRLMKRRWVSDMVVIAACMLCCIVHLIVMAGSVDGSGIFLVLAGLAGGVAAAAWMWRNVRRFIEGTGDQSRAKTARHRRKQRGR